MEVEEKTFKCPAGPLKKFSAMMDETVPVLLENLNFLNMMFTCPENVPKTRLISARPTKLSQKILNS